MAKERYPPEEIVAKLRLIDTLTVQGGSVAEAVRAMGLIQVTYYPLRNESDGLKDGQVERLKELETKNATDGMRQCGSHSEGARIWIKTSCWRNVTHLQ